MKIVVIVRTREEERNIERFCKGYGFADHILVADANSQDRTRELALRFPNVRVRIFDEKVELQNGYKRNKHSEQINFLIDWAYILQPDWVIFDDCDCWPNANLKAYVRTFLNESPFPFAYVERFYLYKDTKWFPQMTPDTSLWAWKPETGMRCLPDTETCHQRFNQRPGRGERLNIERPHVLLHNPWQDDEMIEKKLKFYRESGLIPGMLHPLQIGGILQTLPEYAYE